MHDKVIRLATLPFVPVVKGRRFHDFHKQVKPSTFDHWHEYWHIPTV